MDMKSSLPLLAGFEPARGNPNGFLVHRLNHSAKNGAKGTAMMRGRKGKGGEKGERRGEREKDSCHTSNADKTDIFQNVYTKLCTVHRYNAEK